MGEQTLAMEHTAMAPFIRRLHGDVIVWVLAEQDASFVAQPRAVRVGRTSRGVTELVNGDVRVGDWVVIRGNETLRAGQPVEITERLALDS